MVLVYTTTFCPYCIRAKMHLKKKGVSFQEIDVSGDKMKLVADRYHPVAANEVLEAARGGAPLPRDAVLVTVDDGYRDFLDTIFPVCSRYGIHPLLFVPTAYVGAGTFWWDKVYQIIFLSGQTEIETPIGRLGPIAEGDRFRALHQLIRALKQMPFDRVENWVETTHASAVHLPEEKNHNTLTWDELRRLSQQGVRPIDGGPQVLRATASVHGGWPVVRLGVR